MTEIIGEMKSRGFEPLRQRWVYLWQHMFASDPPTPYLFFRCAKTDQVRSTVYPPSDTSEGFAKPKRWNAENRKAKPTRTRECILKTWQELPTVLIYVLYTIGYKDYSIGAIMNMNSLFEKLLLVLHSVFPEWKIISNQLYDRWLL